MIHHFFALTFLGLLSKAMCSNVVVIMTDDLGWGDVGFNGNEATARTPFLDELSRSRHSVIMDEFYSAASVCSPTRASLLTGRHPSRDGIDYANVNSRAISRFPLRKNIWTILETLKEQGIKTSLFGKWHLGDMKSTDGQEASKVTPMDHGFQFSLATKGAVPTISPNCDCFNSKKSCKNNQWYGWGSNRRACSSYWSIDVEFSEEILISDTAFLTGEFDKYVKSLRRQDPFVSYMFLHDPHLPFPATPEEEEKCSSGETCKDLKTGISRKTLDYFCSVVRIDQAVGSILDTLRTSNRLDDTIILFTSDNGPETGRNNWLPGVSGGRGRKRSLWRGGVSVPGLIHAPSIISTNRRSRYVASTSDVVPTLIDLYNLRAPTIPLDGISLLPFLRSSDITQQRTEPLYFQQKYGKTRLSVIAWPYKLTIMKEKRGNRKKHLYNIEDDPMETMKLNKTEVDENRKIRLALYDWVDSVKSSRELQGIGPLIY